MTYLLTLWSLVLLLVGAQAIGYIAAGGLRMPLTDQAPLVTVMVGYAVLTFIVAYAADRLYALWKQ